MWRLPPDLASVPAAAFEGAEARAITLNLQRGLVFEMTGAQFVRDWALPQFYFRAVTACDILRHNGVALSKRDYVAHAVGHLKS